jgi:cyclopropane fatty-acyl-phospholipid synthase-like methyltransferase
MKIRIDIIIDADRETVWRSFDNPEDMSMWQPMIETVTERREPDFIAGTYESARSKGVIVNHFETIGNRQTRWSMYANHTFKGIYRLFGIFFAGSIRKRSEEVMNNFKLYTETVQAERAQ